MGQEKDDLTRQVKIEFDKRAKLHADSNAVLDASGGEATAHANILRDYLSKYYIRKFVTPNKEDTILDFGSGVGRSTAMLGPDVKKICGVDLSPEMVIVACSKYPKLDFRLLETNQLPFGDNYFTKCFSWWVLQHMSDEHVKEILSEMFRCTTPGGKIILMEQTRLNRWQSGFMLHRSFDQYREMISQSGFILREVKPVFRYPSYAMHFWKKMKSEETGKLKWLRMLDELLMFRNFYQVEYFTTAFVAQKPE